MSLKNCVPSLNPMYRLQWENYQEAYVLLYPEGMVKLNGSAGEIMAMVDGKRDVTAIATALSEKFPEAQGIEADIVEFIQHAAEKEWLQLPADVVQAP